MGTHTPFAPATPTPAQANRRARSIRTPARRHMGVALYQGGTVFRDNGFCSMGDRMNAIYTMKKEKINPTRRHPKK